jgi:hypothetical protein
MKWVTHEHVRVDRVACPWLIKKFVDKDAEFIFVPTEKIPEVVEKEGAIPFDTQGVELGHHGDKVTFDAIVEKYKLTDPAVLLLAEIVRAADGDPNKPTSRKEGWGLYAVATGFREMGLKDDHEILKHEFIVYDALYVYCQTLVKK